VSLTDATELERALLRSGDDLYRLALLLAPDDTQAVRALLKAVRQLAVTGAAPDEHALYAALLAAQPPERPQRPYRRPPAWARPPAVHAERAPLLSALARLPRAEREALGLTMLRAFEPSQAAPLLGGDELAVRMLVRDALLALAPAALPTLTPATVDSALAPEDCRPTRAALGLNDPALHRDAALRGHLALCAACRAAEQAWQTLTRNVEEALRGALREVRLPPELVAQLQAAARPEQAPVGRALLADRRVRIALVLLPVLALITFLVWPRGAPPVTTSGSTGAAPQAPAPAALVRRAHAQLYAPPPGEGTWHTRYEILWNFADSSYALLNADLWVEPASGRHRAQLVHHDGGGPYEFELGDGQRSAWYAVSPNYAPSLYALNFDPAISRVQLTATPEAQRQMLQARLGSGAWALAAAYLRQAETTELRTWGRQRAADGSLLDLISFSGVSPLALPPDAPNATTSQVTVLLAIDEASGRLREVRELLGAADSEQTARVTWRQAAEEWLNGDAAIARVFDQQLAWNGTGTFVRRGPLADPALPLAQSSALTSLAVGVHLSWTGLWMPASPPPGTTSALLINHGDTPVTPNQYDENSALTFVYLGMGRRLELSTTNSASASPLAGGEVSTLNSNQLIMLARNDQSYKAAIIHKAEGGDQAYTTQIEAFGYTRAELLDVIETLGPPSLAAYRAQARLFASPQPHDAAAFEALLGALEPPPAGAARHFVERVFKRQDHRPDPLGDPYHLPPYGGWPEQLIQDNWSRGDEASGTAESAANTRGDDGTIYARQYLNADHVWYYDARASRVSEFPRRALGPEQRNNEDQNTILRMIACGNGELQTRPDGTRTVRLTEDNWQQYGTCMHPEYSWLLQVQTNGDLYTSPDQTPYLADQIGQTITTLIDLGADGRAVRTQVWAGAPERGTLLQSWERLSDEQVPAGRVPAAAFESKPPAAMIQRNYAENDAGEPAGPSRQLRTLTITEAAQLVRTPLLLPSATPAPTRTVVITRSGELTPTTLVITEPPALDKIETGAPDQPGRSRFIAEGPVFDAALLDGYALRFSYIVRHDRGALTMTIYEGPADSLGAYLRAAAQWSSSTPVSVRLGKRQVNGWRVTERRGSIDWLLFEVDGTLVAVRTATPEILAVIEELEPRGK
jgi:hypothetical protein